jgi:methylated-DNA-[protein]-cysteine S-methyltransferase
MVPIQPPPKQMKPPSAEHYCIFSASIGLCGIAWSEHGVTAFQLPEGDRRALEARMRRDARQEWRHEPPQQAAHAVTKLKQYFDGEKVAFSDLTLDLHACSLFHKAVYEAARKVAWGETTTYGQIARNIGSPHAARAVGHALSRNPIAIIIPCHRVLAAGAKIGGFSAHGGIEIKERLLEMEGAKRSAGASAQQLLFSSLT